jgi:hypothetical protein
MDVPTSEVGHTAAMLRREDHEVHKDMWWGHWTKNKSFNFGVFYMFRPRWFIFRETVVYTIMFIIIVLIINDWTL